MLQEKACDLVKAAQDTRVTVATLQAQRTSDELWETLYEKAVSLAATMDVSPSMPRGGPQRNRPNAPSITPSDFWRVNMFYPFIDHMVTEITSRLLSSSDRFVVQSLMPSNVKTIDDSTVKAIFDACGSDLTDYDSFSREIQRWVTRWTVVESPPSTADDCLEGALKLAHVELYPNIRRCIELLLAMPVSTSTAERSFSTMKRVKSYLRNSMTTERLSGLALMNIYREHEISAEQVVDIFARRKPRRMALLFKATQ